MKNRLILGAIFGATMLSTSAVAQYGPMQTADATPAFAWPAPGETAAIGSSVTEEQVEDFLTRISAKLWPGWATSPVRVKQFRFVRLWPGRSTLLATADGGRRGYPYLDAVDWENGRAYLRMVEADQPFDLDTEVVDLDKDGIAEIITSDLALGYQGTSTKPVVWRRVFKARADHSLEDVSPLFRSYFEKRIIPELDATEVQLEKRYSPGPELEEAKAQVQLIRFRYRRQLYGDKDAGAAAATDLAQSPYAQVRRVAVELLADLDTEEARRLLTNLSYSAERWVAGAAEDALKRRK